jgi:hypothetical protein
LARVGDHRGAIGSAWRLRTPAQQAFEFGLQRVLDGIEALVERDPSR